MKLILASQSPRRRELMALMGLTDFEIRPARGEERADPALAPGALVEALARQKARQTAAEVSQDAVIVAADTVVAVDGRVLGKPKDAADARAMLALLSGRTHTVYTGVTVRRGEREITEHESTEVDFRPLTPEEIAAYVDTGEPMDKAGAYGIQGRGCILIRGIRGDYFNVMGLPVCRLAGILRSFGIDPLRPE